MELIQLEGLNPREYEHPLDQKTLNALEKTPGLDLLVRKFYDLSIEKFLRLEFIGSNLKVTASSFPDLYDLLDEACETLNLHRLPEFYVRPDDYFRNLQVSTNNLQGLTVGVEHPLIVISTACIESFSGEELCFILGCEIGRIKSQHSLYENIAWLLPILSNIASAATFGIDLTAPLLAGVSVALAQWSRMADYTADRAGLLACQDITVAMSALSKIAGLPKRYFDSFNVDTFITQVREFEGFGDTIQSKFVRGMSLISRDQAFTIARAQELLKWVDSGEYQAVRARTTKIQAAPTPSFCRHCGSKLEASAVFCSACGKRVAG
jgi:Zn-dependent protease with chaperone function